MAGCELAASDGAAGPTRVGSASSMPSKRYVPAAEPVVAKLVTNSSPGLGDAILHGPNEVVISGPTRAKSSWVGGFALGLNWLSWGLAMPESTRKIFPSGPVPTPQAAFAVAEAGISPSLAP